MTRLVAAAVALLRSTMAVVASSSRHDASLHVPQPHIVLLVADDFGWANAGWHRPQGSDEVRTPRMNELVSHGIELNRAYQYKFCSPSRSSLQSGRLPVHVNFVNADPAVHNPADPVSGFAGIPPAMTGIAEHLKYAGYLTHFIGKWDCGMATPSHLPIARGYDSSLHYFHHANDYFTEKTHNVSDTCPHDVYPMRGGGCFTDMWDGAFPAIGQNGTAPPNGTTSHQSIGYPVTGPEEHYEEYKFKQRALEIIAKHPVDNPLFLCYCFHIVHEPLQVPQAYYDAFDEIKDDYFAMGLHHRRTYHAMVSYMDGAVGDVVDQLRSSTKQRMWNETLVVFQTDNGGPSFAGGLPTANNFPHKGTKSSNWEGGIRGNAFVSGGYLQAHAPARIGTKIDGITHICDWYATLAHLAGVDPTDHKAAKASLPPIDSVNLWPYLSGAVAQSPRTEVFADPDTLIVGNWKLVGANIANASDAVGKGSKVNYACWMGPRYPNGSMDPKCHRSENCVANGGCLYNIETDVSEHEDIALLYPSKLQELQNRLANLQTSIFQPDRGTDTGLADYYAKEIHGGYWGPFLNNSLLDL